MEVLDRCHWSPPNTYLSLNYHTPQKPHKPTLLPLFMGEGQGGGACETSVIDNLPLLAPITIGCCSLTMSYESRRAKK